MRTRASSSLALLMTFALFACGGGDDNGGDVPGPGPGPNGNGNGNGSADVTVTIEGLAFIDPDGNQNEESVVTIAVGETVEWVNNGEEPHTATSSEEPEGGDPFDISLPVGESRTHTFNTAGEWVYFCEIHPGIMVDARIIVE